MFNQPPSTAARSFAGAIAFIAGASLVLEYLAVRWTFGYDALHVVWVMARYLTILTTALVAATFGLIASSMAHVGTRWLTALTLASLLVAAGFHTLLRGINPLEGLEYWSDIGFHSLGPALVALYWLLFARRGQLNWTDVPFFMLWPAIYLSYALTRGGLDGRFPYPFLDPLALGWTPVFWTIGTFALGIAVAGVLLVLLDRVIDRVTS